MLGDQFGEFVCWYEDEDLFVASRVKAMSLD